MAVTRRHFTLDSRGRENCRAHRWRRGLSAYARHLPRRLRTLAWHPITLRQGARVIEDSRHLRVVWDIVPGPIAGCWTAGLDLGERWSSRLVAMPPSIRLI